MMACSFAIPKNTVRSWVQRGLVDWPIDTPADTDGLHRLAWFAQLMRAGCSSERAKTASANIVQVMAQKDSALIVVFRDGSVLDVSSGGVLIDAIRRQEGFFMQSFDKYPINPNYPYRTS